MKKKTLSLIPLDDLHAAIRECRLCRLGGLHSQPIPGYGNPRSPVVFIAEAPGEQEAKQLRPLVGPTGKSLAAILSNLGISLNSCYRTNIVKCWTGPGNPTPEPAEQEECRFWLDGELTIIEPRIVVAMGTTAAAALGVEGQISQAHGRPIQRDDYVLLPTYHPAAALHNPALHKALLEDFAVLPALIRGETPRVGGIVDQYPSPKYELWDWDGLMEQPPDGSLVAVDTETDLRGELWCISISWVPGHAMVVKREDMWAFRSLFHPPYQLVFHNATFDINVLARAGIEITAPVHDTMLMAHVLEEERLSLKWLAARYLGMEMVEYGDMIAGYGRSQMVEYLAHAASHEWKPAPPDETLVWNKKTGELEIKSHQPQKMEKKAARILSDVMLKGADPWQRWHKLDQRERDQVELEIGPMPQPSLSDIPIGEAVVYSARDADACLRLYHFLKNKLESA